MPGRLVPLLTGLSVDELVPGRLEALLTGLSDDAFVLGRVEHRLIGLSASISTFAVGGLGGFAMPGDVGGLVMAVAVICTGDCGGESRARVRDAARAGLEGATRGALGFCG